MERRGVDMVRLEQPEEVYDVEQVLGRDAASVFPSMNQSLDPMEQLKAAIGAKRFVTESELEEIKAARGLHVDDGTMAADKPLAEILAERKKAKQDAFDEQWKQMKTGKNRPLEPDELEFLDALAQQEAEQQRQLSQQEAADLEAYRQAVAAAAEAKKAAAAADGGQDEHPDTSAGAADGPGPSSTLARSSSNDKAAAAGPAAANSKAAGKLVPKTTAAPIIKPILKVKPKGAQGAAAATAAAAQQPGGPDVKRPRLEQQQQQQQQQQEDGGVQAGLAGLLGGYGSGSDSDG